MHFELVLSVVASNVRTDEILRAQAAFHIIPIIHSLFIDAWTNII